MLRRRTSLLRIEVVLVLEIYFIGCCGDAAHGGSRNWGSGFVFLATRLIVELFSSVVVAFMCCPVVAFRVLAWLR